ncbi:urokinase plasminogen activator surface receptor-like [Megalobrama amblycephala]|uniref:urokinase plasminogen activator surface receptor-like n=1 Tax=Megalobrama amblycephala TaxID=75352 RepID=UPI002013FC83|nr:urokinase plasminogen activator surface receptor-like [Megalobrama amblycephala]
MFVIVKYTSFDVRSNCLCFITTGHSLSCYECKSQTGSCAGQTVKTCPGGSSQCLSSTAVPQNGTKEKIKHCAPVCQNGSLNTGSSKLTISCCNTDQCNTNDAPDYANVPNGKTCYSCDGQSCSNILNCSGTEDRCITATATVGGQSAVLKGCASKSMCDAASSVPNFASISCCEGNLCNGAQSVSQSFLFLCCSLLSYFLLH